MIRMTSVLVLLTQLLPPGCQLDNEEDRRMVYQAVQAVSVAATSEFEIQRSFTGVVLPAQSTDIGFEFGGTIQELLVNEGDRVAAGALLARLDTALLGIERRQLRAQLAEADANLRLALTNLKRQTSLETDGYVSRARRDELEATRDAIRANISRLQATLDGNQVRLEKAHLYAPFAGVIGERYLEQGSSTAPGVPVLRLLETGRMEAHVGIPRQLTAAVHRGDTVEVLVGELALTGKVLAIGADLKAQSHTVKVRIALPATDVLSGSLVRLQLPDHIRGEGFEVPESALSASLRGLWRVYVLNPGGGDLFQVEARDLQLRYTDESRAYVIGGLKDGEMVVANGVHKVVPGQLVRVQRAGDSN